MNHKLLLTLELLEQAAWGFHFRLAVQNGSRVNLLLPAPEIMGIRFCKVATNMEAEWYSSILVSAASGEFILQPNELRVFEWRVRPCEIARPESCDDFDYHRWCVGIAKGNYAVLYRWHVDEEYFDPDSHLKLSDLENIASRERAAVWQGKAESNQVMVVRM